MSHTFALFQNFKKVKVLGKICAHADDKPGHFFKWPNEDC